MRTVLSRFVFVSAVLGAAASASGAAHADTTIVNINGAGQNGAGVATSYAYPLLPGSLITMVNPVVVNLAAGDYTISDGWGQSGALYDAWNYQLAAPGSWDSHFYVGVEQGTTSTYQLLIDGLSNRDPSCTYHNCSWATEALASAAFLATPSFALHLAADAAVSFSSTDFYLVDNAGGISLAVTPLVSTQPGTVPEPSEYLLLLLALPMILCLRRKSPSRTRGPSRSFRISMPGLATPPLLVA